ncbi:hypothetical protein GCM10010885_10440 [Alicyclobacillus cellulosilyticus]|uniref:Uncharacterized protein n=1 Tax=Alicyclobacillus cellulosilyticus TaxID=1003997 RepID=A0A917K8L4_9BACL|nr:hypothetical protein GCM10010885_10440 [Alicyclobacillus cellulosilyticus]
MVKVDKPKRKKPAMTIYDVELPQQPQGKPRRRGSTAPAPLPIEEPKERTLERQEPNNAPAYVVAVDGSPVASLTSLAEALEALAESVRSMRPTPGHTAKVELLDGQGKALRVCYLPPWPKGVGA